MLTKLTLTGEWFQIYRNIYILINPNICKLLFLQKLLVKNPSNGWAMYKVGMFTCNVQNVIHNTRKIRKPNMRMNKVLWKDIFSSRSNNSSIQWRILYQPRSQVPSSFCPIRDRNEKGLGRKWKTLETRLFQHCFSSKPSERKSNFRDIFLELMAHIRANLLSYNEDSMWTFTICTNCSTFQSWHLSVVCHWVFLSYFLRISIFFNFISFWGYLTQNRLK